MTQSIHSQCEKINGPIFRFMLVKFKRFSVCQRHKNDFFGLRHIKDSILKLEDDGIQNIDGGKHVKVAEIQGEPIIIKVFSVNLSQCDTL